MRMDVTQRVVALEEKTRELETKRQALRLREGHAVEEQFVYSRLSNTRTASSDNRSLSVLTFTVVTKRRVLLKEMPNLSRV